MGWKSGHTHFSQWKVPPHTLSHCDCRNNATIIKSNTNLFFYLKMSFTPTYFFFTNFEGHKYDEVYQLLVNVFCIRNNLCQFFKEVLEERHGSFGLGCAQLDNAVFQHPLNVVLLNIDLAFSQLTLILFVCTTWSHPSLVIYNRSREKLQFMVVERTKAYKN